MKTSAFGIVRDMLGKIIEQKLLEMAHCNWHIHSIYSPCAAPEMTVRNILRAADNSGLRTIALVDHHHPGDKDMLSRVMFLKADVERIKHKVTVIVGAELSAFGEDLYGEDIGTNHQIDYRLYACNHYHIRGWEHPRRPTPQAYMEHSLAILRKLIPSERAGCIAHPFLGCYLTHYIEDPREVTRLCADKDLRSLFELAKRHHVAWEISTRHLVNDPVFGVRFLRIGFEMGVDFRLGTDAHTLAEIDTKLQVRHLIQALDSVGTHEAEH